LAAAISHEFGGPALVDAAKRSPALRWV